MVAATCVVLLGLISGEPDSTPCGPRQSTADTLVPGRAFDGPRVRIRLQVVPMVPLPDHVLETIVGEAAAIWAPYDVEVTATRDLERPDGQSFTWMTLIIRDTPAPTGHGPGAPDGRAELACLAFVGDTPVERVWASLDSARRLVAAAGLDRLPAGPRDEFTARILGRAIAHELGHYLLGTKTHAAQGLMRVTFGARDVQARDHEGFRLERTQAATLVTRYR